MFDWKWDFTFEIMPRLGWATLNTLMAAGFGYLIALFVGLAFALLQRTGSRPLTLITREIVEFIRSTPLVVQIFFVFYVGPQFGVRLSPWTSGMIAIGLPGMGNYLVGIFKDTPMLSVIGVAELMHTATALGSETYRYLEPYTMVGLIFLAISIPTAFGLRRLEAWVRRSLGMTR